MLTIARGGWPGRAAWLGAALAFACAGCGGHGRSSPTGSASQGATSGAPRPPAPPRPVPPSPTGRTALRAHLAAAMRRAGPGSGAYVYDVSAGRKLFAVRADVSRPPASVEKIYTSVAALVRLGAAARLDTTVLGDGSVTRGGTWHGNLFLQGGGDPTLGSPAFVAVYDQGHGSTVTSLATQLVSHDGIRRVTGSVLGDESLFDSSRGGPSTGYRPDVLDLGGQLSALTYNHGASSGDATASGGVAPPRPAKRPRRSPTVGPAPFAALALVHALHAEGVRVHAARDPAVAPDGAVLLARVSSPPLSEMLGLMNRTSDDFFAEMLVKQLGVRFGGSGSLVAGAGAIAQAMSAFGIHPRILDGSGLSRADSTTPHEVVRVLSAVAKTAVGGPLRRSLPVAAISGTLAPRMRHTAAAGRCQAKTGTLIDVSNLAGYCRSRGGHLIAFAFFMHGPRTVAEHTLQDSMTITLARDDPRRR